MEQAQKLNQELFEMTQDSLIIIVSNGFKNKKILQQLSEARAAKIY